MGSPRFEGKPGSNPEELIGAAHAACFTMALSRILGDAELTAEQMETKAEVTLEKQGDGFAITSVHLTLVAKIPGADKAKFAELVGMARVEIIQYQDYAGGDAALKFRPPRCAAADLQRGGSLIRGVVRGDIGARIILAGTRSRPSGNEKWEPNGRKTEREL